MTNPTANIELNYNSAIKCWPIPILDHSHIQLIKLRTKKKKDEWVNIEEKNYTIENEGVKSIIWNGDISEKPKNLYALISSKQTKPPKSYTLLSIILPFLGVLIGTMVGNVKEIRTGLEAIGLIDAPACSIEKHKNVESEKIKYKAEITDLNEEIAGLKPKLKKSDSLRENDSIAYLDNITKINKEKESLRKKLSDFITRADVNCEEFQENYKDIIGDKDKKLKEKQIQIQKLRLRIKKDEDFVVNRYKLKDLNESEKLNKIMGIHASIKRALTDEDIFKLKITYKELFEIFDKQNESKEYRKEIEDVSILSSIFFKTKDDFYTEFDKSLEGKESQLAVFNTRD